MTEAHLLARFWSKVDQSAGPVACWPWLAAKDEKGYGLFKHKGKMVRASRIALRSKGEFAPELNALHSCDNPPCCNPEHLWAGTSADNAQDRDDKGRSFVTYGSTNGSAKLTEAQVLYLRARYRPRSRTRSAVALAAELGVCAATVRNIIKGRRWGHLGVTL